MEEHPWEEVHKEFGKMSFCSSFCRDGLEEACVTHIGTFFASILEAFEPPRTYFWRLFLPFGGKSPTIVAISLTNWSQGRRRSAAMGFDRPTGMPEGLKLETKMEDLCIFSELLSQQLRLWPASLFFAFREPQKVHFCNGSACSKHDEIERFSDFRRNCRFRRFRSDIFAYLTSYSHEAGNFKNLAKNR